MTAGALFLFAIAILIVGVVYGVLVFRRDEKRSDETTAAVDAELFWTEHRRRLDPPIAKLERDKRLPFHGRVRQQIRVIPPSDRN